MDTADWISVGAFVGAVACVLFQRWTFRRLRREVASGVELDREIHRLRARHLQAAVNAAYDAAMEFDQTPDLALAAVTEWLEPMVEAPQEREA